MMAVENKNAEYLRRITQSIINLPTLPTIAAKLIELVDKRNTTAKMIGELIEDDQVLTAKLLKMCNSAYYGLANKVDNVQHAIVLLGFDTVKEVTLSVSVLNYFKRSGNESQFDLMKFWEHSAAVGIGARLIAKEVCPAKANIAFLCGLLHDLGKVVLVQYMPKEYEDVITKAHDQKRMIHDVEREVFGIDHGEVGYLLAEKWKIADEVISVMRYHHNLVDSNENKELLFCVACSNLLVQQKSIGHSGNGATPKMYQDLLDMGASQGVELTEQRLGAWTDIILEEFNSSTLVKDLLV